MNPEDYVSYPLALALKKHGFDLAVNYYYDDEGYIIENLADYSEEVPYGEYTAYENFNYEDFCSAPTLAQAQKWLRENKGIAINVIAHDGGEYHTERIILPTCTMPETGDWCVGTTTPMVDTYESALSAGIAAALELIDGNKCNPFPDSTHSC